TGKLVSTILPQINDAIFPETLHRLSILRVDGEQSAVQSTQKDPSLFAASPKGHATIDKQVVGAGPINLGVKNPKKPSSFGVKSQQAAKGSGEIHHSIRHQRRAFK